jgi:hypothetical protein
VPQDELSMVKRHSREVLSEFFTVAQVIQNTTYEPVTTFFSGLSRAFNRQILARPQIPTTMRSFVVSVRIFHILSL